MKLLKFVKNDLDVVRGREEVLQRLLQLYKPYKVNLLFNFYCSVQFSQSYRVEKISIFVFNPFEYAEVI